jgi:hypothetical protein
MSARQIEQNPDSKSENGIAKVLVPALASVVVALITTLGALYASTSKLDEAKQSADAATEAAKTLTSQTDLIRAALAASPVPVGSVMSSPLTPDEFSQAAGDATLFDPTKSKWALADGRQVVGSTFDNLVDGNRVPDLRGLFLRGMNAGRSDALRDPDDQRLPGTSQAWATGLPKSGLQASTEGEHAHNGPQGSAGFVGGGAGAHASGEHAGPAYGATAMSNAGAHVHSIAGGDAETRPNNAAVYFYMRINP